MIEPYPCEICGAPAADYEPKMCCDGRECECGGQPIDPCLCSTECAAAMFSGGGGTFEDRRIAAGITDRHATNQPA